MVTASSTLLVDIWYARNEQISSPDDTDAMMTPRMREIHDRVRETYNQCMNYSEETKAKLFEIPLAQRLLHRPLQLIKWLRTVDLADKGPWGRKLATVYSYFHPCEFKNIRISLLPGLMIVSMLPTTMFIIFLLFA